MSGKAIEFYWDTGSTNSYFAFHLIGPIARKHGATVVPRPFNLGYVFRKHDYVLMEEPAVKIASRKIDLARWARKYDLPFCFPTKFPIKTSPSLRGALAMRRFGEEWAFMDAVLAAYWERDDAGIERMDRLAEIAGGLGVDPHEFARLADSDEVRGELAAETDVGLARGVFGAPTFFVGDEMFWGKDRMDFIDDALSGRP